MSHEVTLPVLGESVTSATVSRWLKKVGDAVAHLEPLVEVSTDKVDTEIPSPVSGVLVEIRVHEDETANVGSVLAVIAERVDSFGPSATVRPWSADGGTKSTEPLTPFMAALGVGTTSAPLPTATPPLDAVTGGLSPLIPAHPVQATRTAQTPTPSLSQATPVPPPLIPTTAIPTQTRPVPSTAETPKPTALTPVIPTPAIPTPVDPVPVDLSSAALTPETPAPSTPTEIPTPAIPTPADQPPVDLTSATPIPTTPTPSDLTAASLVPSPLTAEATTPTTPVPSTPVPSTPSTPALTTPVPSIVTPTTPTPTSSAPTTPYLAATADTIIHTSHDTPADADPDGTVRAGDDVATAPAKTDPDHSVKPTDTVGTKPTESYTGNETPSDLPISGQYVTPLVRKLAEELSVDLARVQGSGVGGRVRKQDVLDAAAAPRSDHPAFDQGDAGSEPAISSVSPLDQSALGSDQPGPIKPAEPDRLASMQSELASDLLRPIMYQPDSTAGLTSTRSDLPDPFNKPVAPDSALSTGQSDADQPESDSGQMPSTPVDPAKDSSYHPAIELSGQAAVGLMPPIAALSSTWPITPVETAATSVTPATPVVEPTSDASTEADNQPLGTVPAGRTDIVPGDALVYELESALGWESGLGDPDEPIPGSGESASSDVLPQADKPTDAGTLDEVDAVEHEYDPAFNPVVPFAFLPAAPTDRRVEPLESTAQSDTEDTDTSPDSSLDQGLSADALDVPSETERDCDEYELGELAQPDSNVPSPDDADATVPTQETDDPGTPPNQATPTPPVPTPTDPSDLTTLVGTWQPIQSARSDLPRQIAGSQREIVSATVEVDLTVISRRRDRTNTEPQDRTVASMSHLAFVAKAVCEALRDIPVLNAHFDPQADAVQYADGEQLGIEVDSPQGPLTPVIHGAGELSVTDLAERIADLASRARADQINADELTGGSFTIANHGTLGALMATPLITQGQVATLGIGAVTRRPVVVDDPRLGEIMTIRDMAYLTLTYDHRLIDLPEATRFLATIKARLEAGEFPTES